MRRKLIHVEVRQFHFWRDRSIIAPKCKIRVHFPPKKNSILMQTDTPQSQQQIYAYHYRNNVSGRSAIAVSYTSITRRLQSVMLDA